MVSATRLRHGAPVVERALPFWQPYAWCVLHNTKRIENRTRPPGGLRVGDWFALYATQARSATREDRIAADVYLATGVDVPPFGDPALVYGAILGAAQWVDTIDARDRPDVDAAARASEPWWLGPVGMRLAPRVVAFREPVPCWAPHQGCFALAGPMRADVQARMAAEWEATGL